MILIIIIIIIIIVLTYVEFMGFLADGVLVDNLAIITSMI